MGYIRLGVLPKTPKWRAVVGLLEDAQVPAAQVATQVIEGSKEILASKSAQSSVAYCIWLLTQLTQAARGNGFQSDLSELDIQTADQASASDFLIQVSRTATRHLSKLEPRTAFNNIAGLALREAITRTIGTHANTLFGSGLSDVQSALKRYSTSKQFSNLLHIYFASLLRRTLRFVIDHEITNHLGPGRRFENVQSLEEFEDSLGTFSNQTSRIVDTFSSGWYSKQLWQQGSISQEDAVRFVSIALKKLRADLDISEDE
jgi:hypothetical protein